MNSSISVSDCHKLVDARADQVIDTTEVYTAWQTITVGPNCHLAGVPT
ncbi:MAG: hypothetical protein OEM62_11060 [Acidobacteriota bacterium]|nr:hypothetical protein [Acidobacteriota bacterium]